MVTLEQRWPGRAEWWSRDNTRSRGSRESWTLKIEFLSETKIQSYFLPSIRVLGLSLTVTQRHSGADVVTSDDILLAPLMITILYVSWHEARLTSLVTGWTLVTGAVTWQGAHTAAKQGCHKLEWQMGFYSGQPFKQNEKFRIPLISSSWLAHNWNLFAFLCLEEKVELFDEIRLKFQPLSRINYLKLNPENDVW